MIQNIVISCTKSMSRIERNRRSEFRKSRKERTRGRERGEIVGRHEVTARDDGERVELGLITGL